MKEWFFSCWLIVNKMNKLFLKILSFHVLPEISNIITSYASICTHRCFDSIIGCDSTECETNERYAHSRCSCCQLNCTSCDNVICIFCMTQCATCRKTLGECCSIKCKICLSRMCNFVNCFNKCESCYLPLCASCQIQCPLCESIFCLDALVTCAECRTVFCETCFRSCENCNCESVCCHSQKKQKR